MCNLYDIGPGPRGEVGRWGEQVRAGIGRLAKEFNIRKTDPGLVLRTAEGGVEAEVMRWGFSREFNGAINNARSDKLDSGMWRKAYGSRRCVIPVGAYYEWTGTKGNKRTHVVRRGDRGWLWAAGIWEENEGLGMSYAMITTGAADWFTRYHTRMPAFLEEGALAGYLEGRDTGLKPTEEALEVMRCENPLKFSEPGPPVEAYELGLGLD